MQGLLDWTKAEIKKQICMWLHFFPQSTLPDTGLPSCPDALKEDQHLDQVPKELAGPSLSDLIHNKEKLEKFQDFLNERSAVYVSFIISILPISKFRRNLCWGSWLSKCLQILVFLKKHIYLFMKYICIVFRQLNCPNISWVKILLS